MMIFHPLQMNLVHRQIQHSLVETINHKVDKLHAKAQSYTFKRYLIVTWMLRTRNFWRHLTSTLLHVNRWGFMELQTWSSTFWNLPSCFWPNLGSPENLFFTYMIRVCQVFRSMLTQYSRISDGESRSCCKASLSWEGYHVSALQLISRTVWSWR